MHMCEWMAARFPGDLIYYTMEYIPTTYSCLLIDSDVASFKVNGISSFASDNVYPIAHN